MMLWPLNQMKLKVESRCPVIFEYFFHFRLTIVMAFKNLRTLVTNLVPNAVHLDWKSLTFLIY
jgi:hypothetical protein